MKFTREKYQFVYNYKCHNCGHTFQKTDNLSKRTLKVGTVTDCPKCGEIAGSWNERTDVIITISYETYQELSNIKTEMNNINKTETLQDTIDTLISFWLKGDDM